MEKTEKNLTNAYPEFLSAGGEMARRVREFDWASTALGPVSSWPQSLQTIVSICLNSNFPIAIYWGKELVLLYNDSWSPIPGNKHPWALGHTAKEVWPDIWDAIEPQFEKTFTGEPGGSRDALLPMQRHGYTEECYFDFTFTPVYGEAGKVEGVFNAVIETTYRVINERRTAFLKNFSAAIAPAATTAEVFQSAIDFVNGVEADIPFASIYAYKNEQVQLVASTLKADAPLKNPWPFNKVLQEETGLLVTNLQEHFDRPITFFWSEPIEECYIEPLKNNSGNVTGFLVCGLSSRRRFDADYKLFIEAIGNAITSVSNNIFSLEVERKRSDALAEIDKAKTAFFSNISHEFRTPLTLMLSPLEDVLQDASHLSEREKENLQVSYRNTLRLQKLVNTLLDFSRIEAGRLQAHFESVDICGLTTDLASSFRSAIEKEGMQLHINCQTPPAPVYVDVDMWEKIVLNLISNAFKYTVDGKITVSIIYEGDWLQLAVADTGIGIPQDQLTKVFERFHRVQNTGGRSQEGTGIGLALVQELVAIHEGTITVESKVGEGSIFTVSIPLHKKHTEEDVTPLPRKSSNTNAFLEEASKWSVHHQDTDAAKPTTHTTARPTILVADDNADMRSYITRLLADKYEIITTTNGEDAFLLAIQQQPVLILSDVMMPKLDGFGLLKKLRADNFTQHIPLIFLSARAGEEAKVEGLQAGADDYIVKPFSAKELYARVESQIKMKENREKALHDLYNLFQGVPFTVAVLMGPSLIIEFINDYNLAIWQCSRQDVVGKSLLDVFPGDKAAVKALHAEVQLSGKRFSATEVPLEMEEAGVKKTKWFNAIIDPMYNEQGVMVGQIATSIEITDQVEARQKIEQSEKQLNELANAMPQLVWMADAKGVVNYYNGRVKEFAGVRNTADGWLWEGMVHPQDLQATNAAWQNAVSTGNIYEIEHRIQMHKGSYRWHLSRALPQKDEQGNVLKWFGTATDINEQKKAEERLQFVATLTESIADAVISTDKDYLITGWNKGAERIYGWTAAEAIGQPSNIILRTQFLSQKDAAAWPVSLQNIGYWQGEVTQHTQAGNQVSILASIAVIKNVEGTLTGFVAVNRDISQEKDAERQIRQSEEKFRTLAESLPQLVWVTDDAGVQEFASKRWQEYSGFDKLDKTTWQKIVHPQDFERISKSWAASLALGQSFRAEARLRNADGNYRWHYVQGEPILNGDGQITKWVGAYSDIHDQKTVSEQLEQLVTLRTAELQRSNEDLQQFAHVASHDLKEPIRKVRTFGSRLESEYGELLPEKGKMYLEKMQSSAERMFGLIDGVLNYSTINSLERIEEIVNLDEVFHNIETDLEVVLAMTGGKIERQSLPQIRGSAVLLNQLFYNLINNALKFSIPNVAPVVSISYSRKKGKDLKDFSIKEQEKEFVEIGICDNGIGFAQEHAEKIFKTFTRLNSRDKFEGTGLGLALCKKIAERHDGFIYAQSNLGKGACFYVVLPA